METNFMNAMMGTVRGIQQPGQSQSGGAAEASGICLEAMASNIYTLSYAKYKGMLNKIFGHKFIFQYISSIFVHITTYINLYISCKIQRAQVGTKTIHNFYLTLCKLTLKYEPLLLETLLICFSYFCSSYKRSSY